MRQRWRLAAHRMQMQEAQAQAECKRDGRVKGHFAKADGDIAPTEAEIEAVSLKIAQQDKAVDTSVEQKHLVENG